MYSPNIFQDSQIFMQGSGRKNDENQPAVVPVKFGLDLDECDDEDLLNISDGVLKENSP